MTDTDKLKRLAENMIGQNSEFWPTAKAKSEFSLLAPEAILSLIAENERLNGVNAKRAGTIADLVMDRDEAVALLREIYKDHDNLTDSMDMLVSAFLARIDAANNTVA